MPVTRCHEKARRLYSTATPVHRRAALLANTLRIKRRVTGDGFHDRSTDYYETQVIRAGYTYKF
ncbi:hypothetical protein [Dawidia soli]|uniref:Uncharacterized protein n=1 Tax=Dawidia soli TaxID=2782352 RepID=A0AAP2D6K6_9BACT|nr:hypothetical protein [Dawidia soli]MBT1684960.1 hypothetical protein [Dawidia soli]